MYWFFVKAIGVKHLRLAVIFEPRPLAGGPAAVPPRGRAIARDGARPAPAAVVGAPMTTRTWTVDDVLSYKPCAAYDRARITELFAGRAALTLREILALDIPAADRVWWLRLPGVLTDAECWAWLHRVVRRAVRR